MIENGIFNKYVNAFTNAYFYLFAIQDNLVIKRNINEWKMTFESGFNRIKGASINHLTMRNPYVKLNDDCKTIWKVGHNDKV